MVPEEFKPGKYIVVMDPLDGSSNIDVNVSIGTIFAIFKKLSPGKDVAIDDLLQKGKNLVGAGYIIYGSSTVFVYSTGNGVHGFTLDPGLGEFLLSYPNMAIPSKGSIYSINEGNYNFWSEDQKKYINYLKENDTATNRPYKARYIGSLVADFHRTMLKGGIFIYPADNKSSKGKLRLLYEAIPLAFIVENAGGKASNGSQRILDIQPENFHQRIPLFIGSKENVELAEKFLNGGTISS
jgi:fructose-1,6-bisphosphatase I